ncbi:MAG: YbaK/EbsC family protein [Desulfobacterales bacterium]|nr:MAG: YbaK/EbsC family protein [Desulfobacterales bacterium]
MTQNLSSSAQKVQEALKDFGLTCEVLEMPQTTRTADDAARAVGCRVGQIVKSLVFQGQQTHLPILVATSGANRVSEKKLAQFVAEPILKADADFVRVNTGFAIGGVPPVGHAQRIKIFIDEDLFQFDQIWAAAGTPRAVFKLTPEELLKITNGQVVSVK